MKKIANLILSQQTKMELQEAFQKNIQLKMHITKKIISDHSVYIQDFCADIPRKKLIETNGNFKFTFIIPKRIEQFLVQKDSNNSKINDTEEDKGVNRSLKKYRKSILFDIIDLSDMIQVYSKCDIRTLLYRSLTLKAFAFPNFGSNKGDEILCEIILNTILPKWEIKSLNIEIMQKTSNIMEENLKKKKKKKRRQMEKAFVYNNKDQKLKNALNVSKSRTLETFSSSVLSRVNKVIISMILGFLVIGTSQFFISFIFFQKVLQYPPCTLR
eukprot:TRINITY_DN21557_c0_g1_i1.p1 TRINITY_DN21557_c0_g1~~TRINITY_DN21557_c0_g1_i1.p1  ORF type:complete len:271 (-),score=48.60 TRINITY_DN21557_c0_g1_i1:5-817(-)